MSNLRHILNKDEGEQEDNVENLQEKHSGFVFSNKDSQPQYSSSDIAIHALADMHSSYVKREPLPPLKFEQHFPFPPDARKRSSSSSSYSSDSPSSSHSNTGSLDLYSPAMQHRWSFSSSSSSASYPSPSSAYPSPSYHSPTYPSPLLSSSSTYPSPSPIEYSPSNNPRKRSLSTSSSMFPSPLSSTSSSSSTTTSSSPMASSSPASGTRREYKKKQLIVRPELMQMKQAKAAVKLGIPPSTFSKRWRESLPERKWPYRIHKKVEKSIQMLKVLQNKGHDVTEDLRRLMEQREANLKPAAITMFEDVNEAFDIDTSTATTTTTYAPSDSLSPSTSSTSTPSSLSTSSSLPSVPTTPHTPPSNPSSPVAQVPLYSSTDSMASSGEITNDYNAGASGRFSSGDTGKRNDHLPRASPLTENPPVKHPRRRDSDDKSDYKDTHDYEDKNSYEDKNLSSVPSRDNLYGEQAASVPTKNDREGMDVESRGVQHDGNRTGR